MLIRGSVYGQVALGYPQFVYRAPARLLVVPMGADGEMDEDVDDEALAEFVEDASRGLVDACDFSIRLDRFGIWDVFSLWLEPHDGSRADRAQKVSELRMAGDVWQADAVLAQVQDELMKRVFHRGETTGGVMH